jgi:hypothetical protein
MPRSHWTLALTAAAALLSGCAFMAVQTAPAKPAATTRSEAALRADALFWQTLHGGDYDGIDKALRAVKGAYLQTPGDAVTAAHVGFLHIWRVAERARQQLSSPNVTDDIVLARKYFQEAVALHPGEARYQGFLASAMLAEGSIHKDEKLTRQGWFTMLDAVDAWPEFNLFTAGYAMSGQPADSERFKAGLEQQWRTMDICFGGKIDRNQPSFEAFMKLDTKVGPKRVCWNSWIAPHNFEGFFLNMGDMLVKAGDWQSAQRIYANARLSPDYAQWNFKAVLEQRIAQAQANVAAFNATGNASERGAADDRVMMNRSRFACMACHQQ